MLLVIPEFSYSGEKQLRPRHQHSEFSANNMGRAGGLSAADQSPVFESNSKGGHHEANYIFRVGTGVGGSHFTTRSFR